MKLTAEVLDAMVSAGCTAEQIAAAVKAAMVGGDEAAAERRERDRIRKREQRFQENANKNNARVQSVPRTDADIPSSPEVSPTPPFLTPPSIYPLRPLKGALPPLVSISSGRFIRTGSENGTPRSLSSKPSSVLIFKPFSMAFTDTPPKLTTGRGAILRRGSCHCSVR